MGSLEGMDLETTCCGRVNKSLGVFRDETRVMHGVISSPCEIQAQRSPQEKSPESV